MPVTVVQNFHLSGSTFRDFHLAGNPQAGTTNAKEKDSTQKKTTDVTKEVAQAAKALPKSNTKKWLLIAAWVLTLFLGIALAIAVGVTANSIMADLGTLISTAMAGIGIKLFENAFESNMEETTQLNDEIPPPLETAQ
jgi:hypothetical protein